MSPRARQERTIAWEGRSIRLSYTVRWLEMADHIEVQSEDGAPLPITDTGYRSHFFGPVNPPLTMDEAEAMVITWLNKDAAKQAWQDHLLTTQQLSLF